MGTWTELEGTEAGYGAAAERESYDDSEAGLCSPSAGGARETGLLELWRRDLSSCLR